jgi:pimeloyl-ACP methyl ester carboxylesterase
MAPVRCPAPPCHCAPARSPAGPYNANAVRLSQLPTALVLLAAVAVVLYLGALVVLFFAQERVLFPGAPLPADHGFRFDVPFEEMRIAVPGATLDALRFPQPRTRGLVFFIHGNAGNLETWTTGLDFYRRVGYDLFIFDFRGYGHSTGRVESEAQLHADVRAAYDAIAPAYANVPIVIYGRSLGSGLAVELARHVRADLVVLVTPYSTMESIARRVYPWAPVRLLRYPLRTAAIIGEVKAPLMLLHGTRDLLIPHDESLVLMARATAPVELVTVEGGGHNDVHEFPVYVERLAARLQALAATAPAESALR